MNLSETIKNIRASCNNYVDPDLVATVIHDNYYMGSNNISELEQYDISIDDSFEEKILKILKHENVFLNRLLTSSIQNLLDRRPGLRRVVEMALVGHRR